MSLRRGGGWELELPKSEDATTKNGGQEEHEEAAVERRASMKIFHADSGSTCYPIAHLARKDYD